jgi:hypothetical protein
MKSAGAPVRSASDFFGSMTLASIGTFNEVQPLEPTISLTAAHLVVGALTLATLIVLTLRCYQVLAPQRSRAASVSRALGSSARRAAI